MNPPPPPVIKRRFLSHVLCVCECARPRSAGLNKQMFLRLPPEHPQWYSSRPVDRRGRGRWSVGGPWRPHHQHQRSAFSHFSVSTFGFKAALGQQERESKRESWLLIGRLVRQSVCRWVGQWVCLFFRDCQQTLRGEIFNHSPLACCKPQHEDKSN